MNRKSIEVEIAVKDIRDHMINQLVERKIQKIGNKGEYLRTVLRNPNKITNYLEMEMTKLMETYIVEFGMESYVGICVLVDKENKE